MRTWLSRLIVAVCCISPAHTYAGEWTQLSPAISPPARMLAGIAYDEARDRLVIFGGTPDFARAVIYSDTWEWDGTTWTQIATLSSPPARHAMYMTYDSARKVIVLYGGQHGIGGGSSRGDMWEYDGTDWTQVFPSATPGPRGEGGMAFDRDRQRMVLYGGHIGGGGDLYDTWEYDGTTWTEIVTTTTPSVANNEYMVYDRLRHEVVMHGGCGNGDRAWIYDGVDWTEGATGPPSRNLLSMGYHVPTGRTVVFGGSVGCGTTQRQDTWEWDGAAWQELFPNAPPSARRGMAMEYVASSGTLIGFGGGVNGAANAQTWQYELTCVDDLECDALQDSLDNRPDTHEPAQADVAPLISSSAALAQGWYDPAWQYRKLLIIDPAYVDAPLTGFPLFVAVTLDSGAQTDGDDIIFTDSTGATLAHENERYDAATGALIAWVKIPVLSSTAVTLVYLYYGNAAAPNQENPTSVWDTNYVMVQHLEETSGSHNDSTLYANHGTPSVTTQGSATGQIDGADEFDGVDDYVDCGSDGSLDITGSMTVEAWALSNGGTGSNRILAKDRTGVPGKFIFWNSAGYLAFQVADAGRTWHKAQGPLITHGEWMHAVGVYDAATQRVRLYKNGVSVADVSGPPSAQSNATTTLTIGASEDNQHNWIGIIDEARISNVARSAEWISASYENVNSPASFYVTGSEELEGQNTPPLLIGVSPADGSIDVPVTLAEVSFTVIDSQDDLLNYTVTMTPDVIGGVQSGTAMSSGTAITIPIAGAPLDYDTAYAWTVDVTDPNGSGIVTHRDYSVTTELPPPSPPAFVWWSISDPHLQTDLPGYRSLESAIRDSTYGGDQGGESFAWDIATVAGDWTGTVCPTDSDGQDLVDQWIGAGADPNDFYGVIGNHDANTGDNAWFEKWVDPLGQQTGFSLVDNSTRPYPVQGAWDHYSFEVGNILYLMLSDRNEGPPPFGRLCSAGYPSGRMSLETYNWWVAQVEAHPDHIIITISHQGLFDTTVYTGFDEGYQQGIHGGHSWADRTGSSMIYAIDDWTIDGLDENENYIGPRDFGFVKYLQDHPGAIDLWIHGHTHHNMYPGITFNGRSEVETKYGVTFINTGALTKKHGGPVAPYSRLFNFYANSSTVLMRTYMHSNAWGAAPEGFYQPAEVLIQLDKAFDPCVDLDGDSFCAVEDCNNLDPTVFPDAPEVNDGLDNQCPGDSGFGVIDELSGSTGFLNATDTNEYSWSAQSGATVYEAARSTTRDFSATCVLFSTVGTTWSDGSLPATGQAFYYLSRAVSPNLGSWGQDSSGIPRTVNCPAFF